MLMRYIIAMYVPQQSLAARQQSHVRAQTVQDGTDLDGNVATTHDDCLFRQSLHIEEAVGGDAVFYIW
jgi:hypothetical protein